ncbi:MAG: transglycosylase SLT domain-containing protein [Gemmatimonadales bacterium]
MGYRRRARGRSLRRAAGRVLLLLGWGLALTAGLAVLDLAQAADPEPQGPELANAEIARLNLALETSKGELALKQLEVDRLKLVAQYSTIYKVPANVAALIYDAALAEEIHPSLGFQLVKVESGFKSRARSSANALGYAQVKLITAREIDSTLTERKLLEPETNLRIGFRILRTLLRQFDNDLELALRAYNLGPTGALASLADTTDAAAGAGYARRVMKGVKRATVKKGATTGS